MLNGSPRENGDIVYLIYEFSRVERKRAYAPLTAILTFLFVWNLENSLSIAHAYDDRVTRVPRVCQCPHSWPYLLTMVTMS